MKLESNAAQITRRGFLTLGALGAVALISPQGAFALDGVPADASNIVIEPIENGWRVRDTSTGEVGTVVFPNGGMDSIATMPNGEVIYTCWNEDGTVTQNGVVIGQPEPHITPFASIPAGYSYHTTIHYEFWGLTIAAFLLQMGALGVERATGNKIVADLMNAGAIVAGVLGNVTMDMAQYINWNTGLFYNVYDIYYMGHFIVETTQGPLSSTRP
ncbi:hypothetical protein [Collinsella intestinalis]|uniref:hypothetical protein n=1 Tax=Collinsella intestinalis TaxID=147207 RepID=UPI001957A346|nr:hypothetical protein [Collinsella intestinalis]MBM6943159.1 hypothetical protein [Collinsella intestinalis]